MAISVLASQAFVIVLLLAVLGSSALCIDGSSAVAASEFLAQEIIHLHAAFAVLIFSDFGTHLFKDVRRDDLRKDIIFLPLKTVDAGVFFILQDIIDGVFPKGFAVISYAPAVKFRDDVLDIDADGVLLKEKANDVRSPFVRYNLLALFFISVQRMSARRISFQAGFIYTAAYLSRELCRGKNFARLSPFKNFYNRCRYCLTNQVNPIIPP